MVPLKVKNTGRKRVCSVYKCKNNNTLMVHRGERSSYESLFLCEDCIRELVNGYIDVVGEDHAREVLASSLCRLSEEEKPVINDAEPAENVTEPAENVTEPAENVTEPAENVTEEKPSAKRGRAKAADKGE